MAVCTPRCSARLALPIGPVRLLDGGVAPGQWCGLLARADDAGVANPWTTMTAPQVLITSPDGATREVVELIGPHGSDGATPSLAGGYCTAPWLRGLDHTGPATPPGVALRGSADAPRQSSSGGGPGYSERACRGYDVYRAQELRSRSFAWASFPVGDPGRVLGHACTARDRRRRSTPCR